jgi:uncharacterized protein (UPF0333 family)
MKLNKGQISIEYLIVVAFVTFVVLSVLGIALYYSSQVQDTIKINQMERYARKIISTSESTFYSGEPSRSSITAYLPEGINSVTIQENNIVISIQSYGGNSLLAYPSNVPIDGTLSSQSGLKKISIVAQPDKVSISET